MRTPSTPILWQHDVSRTGRTCHCDSCNTIRLTVGVTDSRRWVFHDLSVLGDVSYSVQWTLLFATPTRAIAESLKLYERHAKHKNNIIKINIHQLVSGYDLVYRMIKYIFYILYIFFFFLVGRGCSVSSKNKDRSRCQCVLQRTFGKMVKNYKRLNS